METPHFACTSLAVDRAPDAGGLALLGGIFANDKGDILDNVITSFCSRIVDRDHDRRHSPYEVA